MSRTVELKEKGKNKYQKICFPDRLRKPTIRGLKPNKKYELREEDREGSRVQECEANDKGEITLVFRFLGFECY